MGNLISKISLESLSIKLVKESEEYNFVFFSDGDLGLVNDKDRVSKLGDKSLIFAPIDVIKVAITLYEKYAAQIEPFLAK